nr:PREDICTED: uncharacterized protein LOC109040547 [Bemisia tabaci]
MCIDSGIIADEHIDCHKAEELGISGLLKIVDIDFESLKFQRKNRCKPLSCLKTSIEVDGDVIPIDPLLILIRMCIAKKSDDELKSFLSFELAPFPLSLFTEAGMRKTQKSSLYGKITPCSAVIMEKNATFVVDGGFLLHRCVWPRNSTFLSICKSYVKYVKAHYSADSMVIFDGYPENAIERNTKHVERMQRERKKMSLDILFNESMVPTVSQEKFLANSKNKNRLIRMMKNHLEAEGIQVLQAVEDADTLIVNKAIEKALVTENLVFIVGEDIDLFVLLAFHSKNIQNVFFMKPGKGKMPRKVYNRDSIGNETIADNILFLHAFSGCDTNCALFGKGKNKFLTSLTKNPSFTSFIKIFNDANATAESVSNAGHKFILYLYGYTGSEEISINELRYKCFIKTAFRSKQNLAALPPTEQALKQHSLRTYHQVQMWRGVNLNACDWGWKLSKHGLLPITTLQPPAPEEILKMISCKCKKGCQAACTCRKSGLPCTIICANCRDSCTNIPDDVIIADGEEQEEDADDPDIVPFSEDETEITESEENIEPVNLAAMEFEPALLEPSEHEIDITEEASPSNVKRPKLRR